MSLSDPVPELVRELSDPILEHRLQTVRTLGRLGPLASDALPTLVILLEDDQDVLREAVAQAIGQMGLEALSVLRGLLYHWDKRVRRQAVWAIGKLGTAAREALPDLRRLLDDLDPRTATGAAQAIERLGRQAMPAIPELVQALANNNRVICRLAALSLSRIGEPALLPVLETLLTHSDPFVRGEAVVALSWMGDLAHDAVYHLCTIVQEMVRRDQDPLVEPTISPECSLEHSSIMDPHYLGQLTPEQYLYAIQGLARLGKHAEPALPTLRYALQHGPKEYRDAIEEALHVVSRAGAEGTYPAIWEELASGEANAGRHSSSVI